MNELEIRGATATDFRAVQHLLRAAGLPVDDLAAETMRTFLVAAMGDRIAGLIGLEQYAKTGLLRSLVVSPAFRNAGLGRLLVAALESLAAGLGVRELWLLTIDAERYFATLGYTVQERAMTPASIRRTREFSSLCPGDAVLMRKKI